MASHLGVDVGATKLLAVVTDGDTGVVGRERRATPGADGAAVTDAMLSTVRDACDAAGVAPEDLASAGIGAIGPLDLHRGVVVDPANLPGVERIELVDPLQELLDGTRVALFNDAAAGAIGERHAADRLVPNFVYLTISTGIGAGIFVDGNLLVGHDGGAGEVGHWTVDPNGTKRCRCGAAGHWEAYCSGAGIPTFAAHLADEGGVETTLPLEDPEFDASTVFESVGTDRLAARTVEAVKEYNAVGVGNVVSAYAPELIVVGGGVALGAPEQVVDPLRERVPRSILGDLPTIELASLGDDAVAIGAAVGARQVGTD